MRSTRARVCTFKLFSRAYRTSAPGLLRKLRRLAGGGAHAARKLMAESLDIIDPGFCRECKGPVDRPEDPFCCACRLLVSRIGSACARCGLPVVHPARRRNIATIHVRSKTRT